MSSRLMPLLLLWISSLANALEGQDPSPLAILVAYDSRTGNTEAFARAVAEGAESVGGVLVTCSKQSDVEDASIIAADGIIVGSPVHWGNLSAGTKGFIDRIGGALAGAGELGRDSTPTNRTAGAFVTGGSVASGKELARIGILTSFMNFKFIIIGAEDAAGFGTLGPQATTGPSDPGLSDAELDEARRYGKRFAELTKKLRR